MSQQYYKRSKRAGRATPKTEEEEKSPVPTVQKEEASGATKGPKSSPQKTKKQGKKAAEGEVQHVEPDPKQQERLIKSEKPPQRFEVSPDIKQLVLNRPTTIDPMAFRFTLLGITVYVYQWVIVHMRRVGPTGCQSFFADPGNCRKLIQIVQLFIGAKIAKALKCADPPPEGSDIPDVTDEVLNEIFDVCQQLPKEIANAVEHVGKVVVDSQEWYPAWSNSNEDRLFSLCPGLLTGAEISHYMKYNLPNSFLKYRDELNQAYSSNLFNGDKFSRNAEILVVPLVADKPTKDWWRSARMSFKGLNMQVTSIRDGAGESGQLVTSNSMPTPSSIQNYYCYVPIPETMLTLGVAYGVGVTPWVRRNDRHQCKIEDALLIVTGSANEIRGRLMT